MNRPKVTLGAHPELDGDAEEQTLHLRLSADDIASLNRIVTHMQRDPMLARLRIKMGREKAVRYAIQRVLEILPAEAG